MSLRIGRRDIKRMMGVLDQDHETLEDAAQAVLDEAFAIYESKATHTVVGQLYYASGEFYNPKDPAADKVALGNYQTESNATATARSLTHSASTGEDFRSWVLPVHHDTPAKWFAERRRVRNLRDE